MIKRQKINKFNYKEVWAHLIDTEGYEDGNNKNLQCFDLCTRYGIGIADSTIDKVVLLPDGQIRFFYNVNTGDYDSIDNFTYEQLKQFYIDFVAAFNDEEECVMMENAGEGKDPW